MRVSWPVIDSWANSLLIAAGLDQDAASNVVANLDYAERRGFSSHGYIRLPTYISRILAGGINRRPNITIVEDRAAVAVVDADSAIGAHSAVRCVDITTNKASTSGVGVVIARSANHFGAAGHYTDLMASQGFFGIAVCNTDKLMCAPFGGKPVLGSNPLSIAVPFPNGIGPQVDMATTEASYGKILVARDKSQQIPLGWAVNAEGAPTTDPQEALDGALLPAGGPKGFGLAFMIDCLLALGGAATSDEVAPLYGDPGTPQQLGHAFIAISAELVQSDSQYAQRIRDLSSAVHNSGTASATRAPMVPGEPETQFLNSTDTWDSSASTIGQLQLVSQELGVPLPDSIEASLRPVTED